MSIALDHVVVVVDALAEAVARYTAAGFTVIPGGRHSELATENALIVFAGGSYLELLAFRDSDARAELQKRREGPGWDAHLHTASAIGRRFLPTLTGAAGVADFALYGQRLERLAREWRQRGVLSTGPVAMSRERLDGEILKWELLLPGGAHLPFLIEDLTPRALRVPSRSESMKHANGARGIASVTVRVPSVPAAALEYAELLGASPKVAADGATVLTIGAHAHVRLVEGEPSRACAVTLEGATALSDGVTADGVHGA